MPRSIFMFSLLLLSPLARALGGQEGEERPQATVEGALKRESTAVRPVHGALAQVDDAGARWEGVLTVEAAKRDLDLDSSFEYDNDGKWAMRMRDQDGVYEFDGTCALKGDDLWCTGTASTFTPGVDTPTLEDAFWLYIIIDITDAG